MRAALAAVLLLAGCGAPVHKAARNNDAAAIRALAASGADLEAYNDPIDKWTAVEMAAYGGHKEALLALLDGGARPALDRHRSDIERRRPEMIKFIEERAASPASAAAASRPGDPKQLGRDLVAAAARGATADIEAALARGADVDFVAGGSLFNEDAYYPTALVRAARGGHLEAVRLLIAKGAEINRTGPCQYTALMAAAEQGSASVVALLLDAGAETDIRFRRVGMNCGRRDGFTVHLFTEDRPDIARLLKRRPARPAEERTPSESKSPVSDVDAPVRRGAERPDDFALVIGIDDYQTLPKAEFGVRDAQTARRHFEALGVPARNIIALEGSQATGGKLKSYLRQWLPRNVRPESTLFVYYSGHGAPDPASGDAYLVPWDADPMFLETTAYPLKQFYAELTALKAKRVVVALDACFSGSGGRSVLAKGARPLVAKVDESVPAAANLTVLAAASGAEITGSLDDQAHGIFTYHFLKALSLGAKTPRALFDYLKPRVQDDARRQNREQSPTLAGSGADVPF